MNYVEHHFGDYARDTAHLTLLEHGAYRLLLDLYYVREAPLPCEMRDCCRLVRATSSAERKAVESILREFFELTPDGWRHKRCDVEIGRFRSKQDAARRSAQARWSARDPKSGGNANASANVHANASPDAMRTHCDGNAPNHQTPDTRHQTKEKPLASAVPDLPEGSPAGALSRALRAKGIASNPMDPRLRALAESGTTPQQAMAAADAARDAKGPNARIPPAYVLAILERWRTEPAAIPAAAQDPNAAAAEALRMLERRDAEVRTA